VFPLVGAALGAAVGGAAYGLARIMPSLAAAGIALALGALLTGALHLDGLADTADALGARSREGALAIMRDHAIGTYGATALVLDLVVKTAALAALAGRSRVVLEALAAGALSRATPATRSALPSSSRRRRFSSRRRRWHERRASALHPPRRARRVAARPHLRETRSRPVGTRERTRGRARRRPRPRADRRRVHEPPAARPGDGGPARRAAWARAVGGAGAARARLRRARRADHCRGGRPLSGRVGLDARARR